MNDIDLFQAFDDLEDKRAECLRVPFGYVGGKSRTYENILKYLPYRKSFIEVFGGSGIVIANRRSSNMDVFNDRYAGVVAFYHCIADESLCKRLLEKLELYLHAKEMFYWCRDTWSSQDDLVERAARWYYMHETSFVNKGQHWARATHPVGPIGFGIHSKFKLFWPLHERFKQIQVDNLDFRQCIKDYDYADSVMYCDPPYLGVGGGYKHSFTESDHITLLDLIMDCKGFVAISGYPSELYDSYNWDDRYTWSSLVTVKAMAYTKTNNLERPEELSYETATEVLWIKE